MTETIKKMTLMQFLLYAPDEIDVESLLTFIGARARKNDLEQTETLKNDSYISENTEHSL